MFIMRNNQRTEHDDFVLNVEDYIKNNSTNYKKEAVEVRDENGILKGWKIQPKYD